MTTDTTTPPDTRHPYVRFLSALFGAMPPCQMEHEINLIADNPAIGPCVLVTIGQTVATFYPDPSGGWTAGVSVYADEPDDDGEPIILGDVADTGDDPAALGAWVASRLPGLPPTPPTPPTPPGPPPKPPTSPTPPPTPPGAAWTSPPSCGGTSPIPRPCEEDRTRPLTAP